MQLYRRGFTQHHSSLVVRVRSGAGFTLIELLIVIAIIGLLSAIVLAALDESRSRSRDANRASQLQEFLKAAELYYTDNGRYPDDNTATSDIIDNATGFLNTQGGYLSRTPEDPAFDDQNGYYYCATDDGDSMALFTRIENGSAPYCYLSRGPDTYTDYCGTTLGDDASTPIAGLPQCSEELQ